MARRTNGFQTIRSEGGLLPADLMRRVLDPKAKLAGTLPEDYGLPKGERLNEVVTQSWNRLCKHWKEFLEATASLPVGEPATGLTNDKWNLPLLRELGFGLMPTSAGPEIDGRTYAINRFYGSIPIHLIGCGLSLDRRAAGVRGAAAVNPHGLVQEFLNRSDSHLWAIVANGLHLRILRDNQALSRQAYLDFDLEAMFTGEVYSDFVLFWLMAHATRFIPREIDRPDTCWLEQWTKIAEEQGTRALGDLRLGVEQALQILGQGFTSHPRNFALREALRSGQVSPVDFHGQLLRVVYRLIFLFVAEDRMIEGQPLLHPRDDSEAARLGRERYAAHYSTARLRELASKIKGSRHGDLWKQFQILVGAFSGDDCFISVRTQLSLPVLGSFLWNQTATANLNDLELTNYDLLEALRHLAFTHQGKVLRPVDYKNIGAEELGGVYESLLSLTPQLSADGAHFTFAEFAGNERKTSGSYYTPDSLVQCLLDSALDPVVVEAIKGKSGDEAEQAILDLKVCDPAVGSGHFLVGAAHRLARHLARVRALAKGESEPSPLIYQHALRDVIGRCLYGVDINPMAAELCRVNLWLEALEPGKPLSFLDHHIRVGNSLISTTPDLISAGLPDEAFRPIEGDDKKACTALKKINKAQRQGWGGLFAQQDIDAQNTLQQAVAVLEKLPDERPEDVLAKELAFRRHELTEQYSRKKILADAWCAAFVMHKYYPPHPTDPRFPTSEPFGLTQGHLNELAEDGQLPIDLEKEVLRISDQYKFFHWHIAFPEVFARGGFDVVLGNPPWEKVKVEEREFFASRSPEIAAIKDKKKRAERISWLQTTGSQLYQEFQEAKYAAKSDGRFYAGSGRYPMTARREINLYALFAELAFQIVREAGRIGAIIPSGIVTDETGRYFFGELIALNAVSFVLMFSDRSKLFPGVNKHFCLLTYARKQINSQSEFILGSEFITESELEDPGRRVPVTSDFVKVVNPNTYTCPILRCDKDAKILFRIYSQMGILVREQPSENPWDIYESRFQRMFDMTNDRTSHFRTSRELLALGGQLEGNHFLLGETRYLPLYEGKMFHHYDPRWATYDGVSAGNEDSIRDTTDLERMNPSYAILPRYWVVEDEVIRRTVPGLRWQIGIREITNTTNERTTICAPLPAVAFGNKVPLLRMPGLHPVLRLGWLALGSSLALDFASRQKLGALTYNQFYLKQLPFPAPERMLEQCPWQSNLQLAQWLAVRVLELSYTTYDLFGMANDVGYTGEPFIWDPIRRELLRKELDAACFLLYGILPEEAEYILSATFPLLREADEKRNMGAYRLGPDIVELMRRYMDNEDVDKWLDSPPAGGWLPLPLKSIHSAWHVDSNNKITIEYGMDNK